MANEDKTGQHSEIVKDVLAEVMAKSQQVSDLTEVASLEGVNSLPAVKDGKDIVAVPLRIIVDSAEETFSGSLTQIYNLLEKHGSLFKSINDLYGGALADITKKLNNDECILSFVRVVSASVGDEDFLTGMAPQYYTVVYSDFEGTFLGQSQNGGVDVYYTDFKDSDKYGKTASNGVTPKPSQLYRCITDGAIYAVINGTFTRVASDTPLGTAAGEAFPGDEGAALSERVTKLDKEVNISLDGLNAQIIDVENRLLRFDEMDVYFQENDATVDTLKTDVAAKQARIVASADIEPQGTDKLALTPAARRAELVEQAARVGARYNPETGCFSMNGIDDIGSGEMREILYFPDYDWDAHGCRRRLNARTNENPGIANTFHAVSAFQNNTMIEVANFYLMSMDQPFNFSGCTALRRVIGPVYELASNTETNADSNFHGCTALEYVQGTVHNKTAATQYVSFKDSPKLSTDSLQYIVSQANNTGAVNIRLHPEAYARLSDELKAAAEAKKITFTV